MLWHGDVRPQPLHVEQLTPRDKNPEERTVPPTQYYFHYSVFAIVILALLLVILLFAVKDLRCCEEKQPLPAP